MTFRDSLALHQRLCCRPLVYAALVALAPLAGAQDSADKGQARLELAKVLTQDKNFEQAKAEYEQVLKESPDNVEARVGLSKVTFWGGDPKKALEIMKPVPLEKLNEEDRLHLADLLGTQKQYPQAEKLYNERLQAQPDDLVTRLKLADIQSWTKRYDESLANFEKILKARPDDKEVRRKYGMVLSWAGKKKEAIEQLRKSLNE